MTELQGASNKALCAAVGKSKDLVSHRSSKNRMAFSNSGKL